MFNAPPPAGESLPLKDIAGHYLIVKALAYEPGIPTVHGPTDAIRVNVADLSTGTHHLNVLWFGRAVVPSLRQTIGQPGFTLAQVAQGTAKPGQDPPWILVDALAHPGVADAATAWVNANPGVLDGTPMQAPPAAAPQQGHAPQAQAPAQGIAPGVAPQGVAPAAVPPAQPQGIAPGQGLAPQPGQAPPQGGLI